MEHSPRDHRDAFGQALLDHLNGLSADQVIERDDGFIALASRGPDMYFAGPGAWPHHVREALSFARGRTLDIGCGAGRFLVHLQDKGLEVVGIDTSPLALEVCRKRGGRDLRQLSIDQVDHALGCFDTLLLMGNNFSLLRDPETARLLLGRFLEVAADGTRILAEATDPYRTDEPFHLDYHERNRARGRIAGQVRTRIRYRGYSTPWAEHLLVSRVEMDQIVECTGWNVEAIIDSGASEYAVVLVKTESRP